MRGIDRDRKHVKHNHLTKSKSNEIMGWLQACMFTFVSLHSSFNKPITFRRAIHGAFLDDKSANCSTAISSLLTF